jgi:hypothetical protein
MKKLSSRLLAVALMGTVFAAGLGTTAVFAAYSGNDTTAHVNSATITNAECIACHGQKANESSLDPLTFSAHKKHLKSAFVRFASMTDGCGTCHASTDIEQGSGASVNKQVDAAFCVTCHGTFAASSATHGGVDLAATSPRGCTVCHTDPAVIHAAVPYVNKFYCLSRTYCTKCHGGLDFYAVEETN